jgi:hypothetical protein
VFRLLRWFLWLLFWVAVIYFSATVKLGKRTLFGHFHAIFTSREAKELADGTKQEAHKIAEKLRDDTKPSPMDPVTDKDKKALDKLVRQKTKETTK